MDVWDLNAIVLHHRTRFFTAATLAAERVDATGGDLAALLGNLAWAASSFHEGSHEDRATMSFGGALLGSLGAVAAGHSGGPVARRVAEIERAFGERHERIVELAQEGVERSGLAGGSPGAVNEHVWGFLFPGVPYAQGVGVLVRRLVADLSRKAGPKG